MSTTSPAPGDVGVQPRGLPDLPALVVGEVTHRRRGAVQHAFRHRVYQWLVDLDSIPVQPWYLRPFAQFCSSDHLGDPRRPIKANIERYLALNGVRLGPRSRVLMLANARVLGHVFDPLSVFWCYASDGHLSCIVAEVHNTYGERHAYLVRPEPTGATLADKAFHVSPFFDLSGTYALRFSLRPDLVSTSITRHRGGSVAFGATFRGQPKRATRTALAVRSIRQPLMPQRVSALIRVHGIWLWLHRLPVRRRPRHTPQDGV